MHILDKVKPSTARQLATLPVLERRRVVAMTCKKASEFIEGLESEMQAVMDCCVRENRLSPAQVAAAQSFAKWADERYFDLRRRGVHEDVWGNWFRKARLATAISRAFGGDSWENTADAVYELSVMLDDPCILIEHVEKVVKYMSLDISRFRQQSE